MNPFAATFQALRQEIDAVTERYGRASGSVQLLAVSKKQPAEKVRGLAELGQRHFGENYVQEARAKIAALAELPLTWHFIGHLQSNKSAEVAAHFDWVHTLDRPRIAERLNEQRGETSPPLNVCVQVNISGESGKSGVEPAGLAPLLAVVARLPRLRLRGLMALPAPEREFERQRRACRELAQLYAFHREQYALDTLSMGTTADMQAAIAEGATVIRIGTALFGAREPPARL